MSDIDCKKILLNDKYHIVFDDTDFKHIIFGIISTLIGLYVIITVHIQEGELIFKLGLSIFIIFGISAIIGKYETITINNILKTVKIESRRLLFIKGEDRVINFSEILCPLIEEEITEGISTWDIILKLKDGNTKQLFRSGNHEEVEALFNKILIFFMDEKKIDIVKSAYNYY